MPRWTPDSYWTHPTKYIAIVVGLSGVLAAGRALAEMPSTADAELAKLVQQLDSDQFADRREASRELTARGADVFPALEQVALGDSREAAARAIEILKSHWSNQSSDSHSAAQESLQRLSTAANPRVARWAGEILNPTPDDPLLPVRMLPARAALQLQIRALGVNGRRVQVMAVNRNKTTKVVEGDKSVTITEDAQGKIQIEVAQKDANGQTTRNNYQANSVEELRTKQPEAYKIYEKYARGVAKVQVNPLPAPPILPQN